MRNLIVISFLFIHTLVLGQEIRVNGGFVQDSLKIGQPVEYWLSARYPATLDLILPDSNFNFSPFEFASRAYFETSIDSTTAIDSVVYSLQSFEIEPTQYLNLPATVINAEDSLVVRSPLDSVFLIEMVQEVSDSTRLITNTEYQDVRRQFNQPLLLIVVGSLLFIALIVLLIFGKRIRKYFKLRRMTRAHEKFLDNISKVIRHLKESGSPENAEKGILVWSSYMEKLENEPFTKLTSKEISRLSYGEELKAPLNAVDRCIYARMPSETLYQDFQHLEDFAQNRYNRKVNEIKQGT